MFVYCTVFAELCTSVNLNSKVLEDCPCAKIEPLKSFPLYGTSYCIIDHIDYVNSYVDYILSMTVYIQELWSFAVTVMAT